MQHILLPHPCLLPPPIIIQQQSPPSASPQLPPFPAGLSAEDVSGRESEGKRGKPSVEWICALSLLHPFFSFLFSSVTSPAFLYLPCPRCALVTLSAGPRGLKESRLVDGWLKTELQCQLGTRRMEVTNLKVK